MGFPAAAGSSELACRASQFRQASMCFSGEVLSDCEPHAQHVLPSTHCPYHAGKPVSEPGCSQPSRTCTDKYMKGGWWWCTGARAAAWMLRRRRACCRCWRPCGAACRLSHRPLPLPLPLPLPRSREQGHGRSRSAMTWRVGGCLVFVCWIHHSCVPLCMLVAGRAADCARRWRLAVRALE